MLETRHEVLDWNRPGTVTMIAARPGVGKTALALNLASRAIDRGQRVSYLSMAESDNMISVKFNCLRKNIALDDFNNRQESDCKSFFPYFFDNPICAVDVYYAVADDEADVVIVDYLDMIGDDDTVMRELKGMRAVAQATGAAVYVIAMIVSRFEEIGLDHPTPAYIRHHDAAMCHTDSIFLCRYGGHVRMLREYKVDVFSPKVIEFFGDEFKFDASTGRMYY